MQISVNSSALMEANALRSMYALAKLLEESPLSIEILPGEAEGWFTDNSSNQVQSPYLLVEGHLGVPKKILYESYMKAVGIFKEANKGRASTDPPNLIASSSVLLLANPAHQTALNARKRLILEGLLDPHHELDFITALQSARECAKESILWDHRRWLFRLFYPLMDYPGKSSGSNSPPLDLPSSVIQKEFDLVSKACEIYPRNYYAWNHWHFCMDTLFSSLGTIFVNSGSMDVLVREYFRLRQWVERHVSDHSSVHHLCNLTRRLQDYHTHLDLVGPGSLYEHAMSLVTCYPSHETLWLYLRLAICFPDDRRSERIFQILSSAFFKGQSACRSFAWWALRDGRLDDNSVHRSIAGDWPEVRDILKSKSFHEAIMNLL